MTTIFAQRPDRPATAPSNRPIGILGDVDLIVYTADARLLGRRPAGLFRHGLDTATLRRLRSLEIGHGARWRHGDSAPSAHPTVDVALDDILALEVVEPAPAASPAGRSRFQRAIAMRVGPYHVMGELRVRPGTDPVEAFARSSGLVVLRDAWIEYPIGPARRRRLAARLAVNAGRAQSFGLVGDGDGGLPEEPARLSELLGSGRDGGRI